MFVCEVMGGLWYFPHLSGPGILFCWVQAALRHPSFCHSTRPPSKTWEKFNYSYTTVLCSKHLWQITRSILRVFYWVFLLPGGLISAQVAKLGTRPWPQNCRCHPVGSMSPSCAGQLVSAHYPYFSLKTWPK